MTRNSRRLRHGVLLAIVASSAIALGQSGLQITPDGKRNLISKDVGAERWAITLNDEDGTVTGNVFFPQGGEPRFVWCAPAGTSAGQVRLACSGADRCPLGPCSSNDWVFIAEVTLPESFFRPPAPGAGSRAAGSEGVAAEPGQARAGVQLTPDDAERALISKDVGPERWAITRHPEDGTVTGNVFFPGGGEPAFVWCEETRVAETEVDLSCFGADRCAAEPCSPEEWTFIADVTLPRTFFAPPEKVDVNEVVSAIVAAYGEDDGFDAVMLALDRGYSLFQILQAALTRRLRSNGEIRTRQGGDEAPAGPPAGIFLELENGPLGRIAAASLPEVRQKADEAEPSENYIKLAIVLMLADQGYTPDQIVEGFLGGNVRILDPFLVPVLLDDEGDLIPPPNNLLLLSFLLPLPSPTPTPGPTPPGQTPGCGNGTIDPGESCDGENLGGQTCANQGYTAGELSCTLIDCFLWTGDCTTCGNGEIEGGEQCEGLNLEGMTCENLGFESGTLACDKKSCTFDTKACVSSDCGDGFRDPDEECDGDDLQGYRCANFGFNEGELACTVGCRFLTDGCSTCGNGDIEGAEACDGPELRGETCEDLGFASGDLACTGDCQFDVSDCEEEPVCQGTLCPNGSCVPAGADCCPEGGYCDPGFVCVAGGCCPEDYPQLCPDETCAPSGSECCGGGVSCPIGTACVPGGCCPVDQLCPDGSCAPPGGTCCADGSFCGPGSQCVPGGCCPTEQVCPDLSCRAPGGTCCGGGITCDPGFVCVAGGCCQESTPQACPDGSCAPAGWVCCGDLSSCPPGTTCAPGECLL